jgi:hypothetical protein
MSREGMEKMNKSVMNTKEKKKTPPDDQALLSGGVVCTNYEEQGDAGGAAHFSLDVANKVFDFAHKGLEDDDCTSVDLCIVDIKLKNNDSNKYPLNVAETLHLQLSKEGIPVHVGCTSNVSSPGISLL